jgi:two-component system, chemotaxis family, protein-glutamate methylesterase/glutaminase
LLIKILVVDDSAFMRKLVSDLINAEPGFSVIDTARNGLEAIDKINRTNPDVITMDVEMPGLDGLSALKIIMKRFPKPIIMLSSLTKNGAEATLKALELGAFDFVAKAGGPIININAVKNELLQKIRAAANANIKLTSKPISAITQPVTKVGRSLASTGERVVAIGTSTGGPRALQEIITKIPGQFTAGILIVQHMPPGFTKSLADRLNSLSAIEVKEAEDGDIVRPGLALIAPGDYHMRVERGTNHRAHVRLTQDAAVNGHRPAVDPMMESVAEVYRRNVIGVLLTGMGHDGARGLKLIKEQGGFTIAEDQSTAVVFGMPRSAIELGAVDKIVPLPMVVNELV